jgi:polar amino acid transport system substrate-binding protein
MRNLLFTICLMISCTLAPIMLPAHEIPQTTLSKAKESGSITVGVKDMSPPFGYRVAGELTGFDIDLIQMLTLDLGITEVTFVPVTTANRLEMLQQGKVDIVIATTKITRSREHMVDFTIPYFEDGQGFLVAPATTPTSPSALDGTNVAVLAGSTTQKNLAEILPNSPVSAVDAPSKLIDAAKSGAVTSITGDALSLVGLQKQLPDWQLLPSRVSREPYGIAVRQGDADLRDALNEALMEVWDDGRYQIIFDTWFGQGTPFDGLVKFTMPTYPR